MGRVGGNEEFRVVQPRESSVGYEALPQKQAKDTSKTEVKDTTRSLRSFCFKVLHLLGNISELKQMYLNARHS